MLSRILYSVFAILFAAFMVVSNPLVSVAEKTEGAAQEESTETPGGGEEQSGDQAMEADETLKPDEAAGDEAPKY